MVMMGVKATTATIHYEPEGPFPHLPCREDARAMVIVQVRDVDTTVIDSVLNRRCDACDLDDTSDPITHTTLADALARLAPPEPGDLGTAEIAERMVADMATSRAESAA